MSQCLRKLAVRYSSIVDYPTICLSSCISAIPSFSVPSYILLYFLPEWKMCLYNTNGTIKDSTDLTLGYAFML